MRARNLVAPLGAALLLSVTWSSVARAADFDALGNFVPDPAAVAFEPFDSPVRFLPDDVDAACEEAAYEVVTGEALETGSFARLQVAENCAERFEVLLPAERASYKATLWVRHGSIGARMTVAYDGEGGTEIQNARMSPTGRATSDGWIEMASNEFPVDGTRLPRVYARLVDFAGADGVDVDALEVVPAGEYYPPSTCEGVRDPVCGPEALCIGGTCRLGRLSVPVLPPPELREETAFALRERFRLFFGGRKTRLVDLPVALATIDRMKDAKTAWEYWNGFATAGRQLHDWHTRVGGAMLEGGVRGRLNACFIEGDADLTHAVWPKHPLYDDILVSHAGIDGLGLRAGDRLVAIDGEHPIAWARKLVDVDWAYHVATDSASYADLVEGLGGPQWAGGAILRYAREISVIRCDPATGTCNDTIETVKIDDIPVINGGADLACDNRPTYHLQSGGPDATNHYVFSTIFHGRIADTADDEQIYGMVWDTLYGGNDPNGYVNSNIKLRSAEWKASARGVILDHRAGNGGTLDAPEYMTDLVRPAETFAVVRMPIAVAAFDGPSTAEEGIALFEDSMFATPYQVGDPGHDPNLPVALILHRDGSASDYMPLGMKGAPKVKLFGPGPTAGAFSTYIQFNYWGGLSFQIASGDTITKDGEPMIGRGVMPDFVVDQKQSDLLAGVDTIHEAALAWVRQELKP